jgi:hypothetical protein
VPVSAILPLDLIQGSPTLICAPNAIGQQLKGLLIIYHFHLLFFLLAMENTTTVYEQLRHSARFDERIAIPTFAGW